MMTSAHLDSDCTWCNFDACCLFQTSNLSNCYIL